MPKHFDLTALNGTNGFVVSTAVSNSGFASSIDCLDFNQDGYSDLVIGAPLVNVSSNLPGAGQSYIVYGQPHYKPLIEVTSLNGINGFTINGAIPFSNAGHSVSALGDINHDGYPDVGIGAPYANNNAGAAFVLFGTNNTFPAVISLSSLDGSNGFTIIDQTLNELGGCAIAGIGDVNADGLPDIGIGACGNSIGGNVYGLFGSKSFPSYLRLGTLNGTNGFKLIGGTQFGASISSAGDINLDGIKDILIGQPFITDFGRGSMSFVIFGAHAFHPSITVNGDTIGSIGFVIKNSNTCYSSGSFSGVLAGSAVTWVNNFFANQEDAIVIGEPHACNSGPANFVVLPQNAAYSGSIDISNTPFKGIAFTSSEAEDVGYVIAHLGDFNGDNLTDIITAGHSSNAFIVFGSPFWG